MIGKFLLLCAVVYSQAATIHHLMTDDEVRATFHVSRHEVPEYEIRPVLHTLHKRSADDEQAVKLTAFGKDIELNLTPNDGVLCGYDTPVMTSVPDSSKPFGVRFDRAPNPWKGVGVPYHDRKTRSAVVLNKDIDGDVQMSGMIHGDLFVKPVPSRLETLLRNKRNIGTDENFKATRHHVIYRRSASTKDELELSMGSVESQYATRNGTKNRSVRSASDIVYPELLVTIDNAIYKTHGSDLTKALTYLLAFWNCVDLRYRALTEMKIRLNIAGFIISTEEGGTPFMKYSGRRSVELAPTIDKMSYFFYPDSQFPVKYDIAVAMTEFDLFVQNGKEVSTAPEGQGVSASPCFLYHPAKQTFALLIFEDCSPFQGIVFAAHELGHVFGANHDGDNGCPANGFLMSANVILDAPSPWSSCSMKEIRDVITSKKGECLYNIPKPGTPLPKILPGKGVSLDDQCKKLTGRGAYPWRQSCSQLWCGDSRRGRVSGIPLEGSYCGTNKHCINHECVPEVIIPLDPPSTKKPEPENPPKVKEKQPPKNNETSTATPNLENTPKPDPKQPPKTSDNILPNATATSTPEVENPSKVEEKQPPKNNETSTATPNLENAPKPDPKQPPKTSDNILPNATSTSTPEVENPSEIIPDSPSLPDKNVAPPEILIEIEKAVKGGKTSSFKFHWLNDGRPATIDKDGEPASTSKSTPERENEILLKVSAAIRRIFEEGQTGAFTFRWSYDKQPISMTRTWLPTSL